MTDRTPPDDDLIGFFDAARVAPETPDSDLLDRVFADAITVLPATAAVKTVARHRLFFDALSPLWGWSVGASLTSALAVGVVLGISPPEAVLDVTTSYFATESFSDLTGIGTGLDFTMEGS